MHLSYFKVGSELNLHVLDLEENPSVKETSEREVIIILFTATESD